MPRRTEKKLARVGARVPDDLREFVTATAASASCTESEATRALLEAWSVHGREAAGSIVRSRLERRGPV